MVGVPSMVPGVGRGGYGRVFLLRRLGIRSILALRFGDNTPSIHRKELYMAMAKKLSGAKEKVSRVAKKAKLRARKTVRAAKRAGQKTQAAAKKAAKTVKGLKPRARKTEKTAQKMARGTGKTVGATLGKAFGTVEHAVSQVLPATKSTPE